MMNTRLFRKASIDRLSSPEELDQVIRISNSGAWTALLAIFLLCGAASVWAVSSGLPTTAIGQGLIVRSGGVINVVSRGAGVVLNVGVGVGQHVDANQVIARVAQPELVEKLRQLREAQVQLAAKRAHEIALKSDQVAKRLDALQRQRANTERSIVETTEQARLAAEQVPVMQQLFTRGLVTNQQVIAAQQKQIALQGQVEDSKAALKQLDAQEFDLRAETGSLQSDVQFEAAAKAREIAMAEQDLAIAEQVVTPYAGEVLEIKVSPGGMIGSDQPVISIQPNDEVLETLAYVSALQAKDIKVGMEARVSPSTVKPEEFGFIHGKVTFVAGYPATTASLMRNFQNDRLVSALADRGPVTEIRVELRRDPATFSGYSWSSAGGPPLKISSGTLTTAEIVTESRAPITLVIPVLRKAMGL
jgi:HlyD family secretion protein